MVLRGVRLIRVELPSAWPFRCLGVKTHDKQAWLVPETCQRWSNCEASQNDVHVLSCSIADQRELDTLAMFDGRCWCETEAPTLRFRVAAAHEITV